MAGQSDRQPAALVSLDVIARVLDLSPRRVQQLVNEGYIPRADRGRYALVPAVHGYIRYLRERAVPGDVGVEQFATQRARLTMARADMAEMERRRLAGELVPASEVAGAWGAVVTTLRTRLLAIPSKVAARLAAVRTAAEAQKIVGTEINEALEELSSVEVHHAALAAAPAGGGGDASGHRPGDGRDASAADAAADADDFGMG